MPSELSAADLARLLGTADQPFLLDVREPSEVADWALPGAVNIPLGQLVERLEELPVDTMVVTVCASGNRSRQAADVVESAGRKVANLTGGMAAWAEVYDTAEMAVGSCTVVQVRRRGKGCLSYLVGAGDEAFVVDPSMDTDIYLRTSTQRGWRISRVFDTHLHADHLSGAAQLAEVAGAALHLNPADPFDYDFVPLTDGDRFSLPGGASLSVAVLHTPGHTEGSCMFFVDDRAVLTGDTIFVDGVGRPDLAERAHEFARNLHRSLNEKVLTLADDVTVLPAHYGNQVAVVPDLAVSAELGRLRKDLAPLSMGREEFVTWATSRLNERPPNYVSIIKANMRSAAVPKEMLRQLEAGPNRCSA